MFHKLAGNLPPRVEKFVMDLQELEYEVVYQSGKVCIADYMSRHHTNRKGSSNVLSIELHVKSVLEVECCHVLTESSAVTMEEIKLEAERCEVYKKLREVVQSGIKDGGNSEQLKPYMVPEIKHELCVTDGIVCRGPRVVVPLALQKRVVELSHRGHQGMSKAESLLQTFCWFPGIDKAVENKVRECLPRQVVQPASTEQPIKPSELPSGPWQYVGMDFQDPYPNGDHIFILIDRYSCWQEMVVFRNAPNANTTIATMKSIFTDKCVPYVCQSDNGSPFQSEQLKEFAKGSGYYHHRVTLQGKWDCGDI